LQARGTEAMRIRTALVTARRVPAHERAIRTLMDWQLEVDEALFLGGLPKGAFLKAFGPDFFFDDQLGHIENAAAHVPAGHVSAGVVNAGMENRTHTSTPTLTHALTGLPPAPGSAASLPGS
jgi:5'-nucleotidase